MKHVFLLDLTGHDGPVQGAISPAQDYLSSFKPELTKWFVTQAQKLEAEGQALEFVEAVGQSVSPQIKDVIETLAADDRLFHVLSYGSGVLLAATALNGPGRMVTSLSLNFLVRRASAPVPPRPPEAFPTPTPRPSYFVYRGGGAGPRGPNTLADAIEATKRILQSGGYNSPTRALLQMQLRPRLVDVIGDKARKDPRDPGSASLISDIVRIGRTEGWLEQASLGRSGTERIYFIAQSSAPQVTASVHASPPVPRLSPIQVPQPALPELSGGRARTAQIKKCLKDRHIYSPKDIRDLFFAALRESDPLLRSEPLTAGRLLGRAMCRSKELAKEQNVSFKFWSHAADAMLETTLAAGVLIGQDAKALKQTARADLVSSVDTDLVNRSEKYLLKYVIATLGDVRLSDRTALAFALFKESPTKREVFEMQQRVDELVAALILTGEVSEGVDGLLTVEVKDTTRESPCVDDVA